jgi:pSer/pThr/pTyr-binding forkhead associated (FHA) protein
MVEVVVAAVVSGAVSLAVALITTRSQTRGELNRLRTEIRMDYAKSENAASRQALAAQFADWALVIDDGSCRSRIFVLPGGRVVLGRDAACDLPISDSRASRQHCSFRSAGDELFVEDLGTSTGTFVNDRKIEAPTAVSADDTITIGSTTITIAKLLGAGT